MIFLLFFINNVNYLNLGKIYEHQGRMDRAMRAYIKALPDTQAFSNIRRLSKKQEKLKIYLGGAYLKIGKERTGNKIINTYLKFHRGKHIIGIGKNDCKYDKADGDVAVMLLSCGEFNIAGKIAEDGAKKWGICGYRSILWYIYTKIDTTKALKFLLSKGLKKEKWHWSWVKSALNHIPEKYRGIVKERIKGSHYDFLYGVLIEYYLDESQPDSAIIFLDKMPAQRDRVGYIHKILHYGIENKDNTIILKMIDRGKGIRWSKDEITVIEKVKRDRKIKELVNIGNVDEAITLAAGNGEWLSKLLILKGDYISAKPYLEKMATNDDLKALDWLILINYKEGDEAKKMVMKEIVDTTKLELNTPLSSLLYSMEYKLQSTTGDSLTAPYSLYLRWKKLIMEDKRKEAEKILDTLLIKFPQSTPSFIINNLKEEK